MGIYRGHIGIIGYIYIYIYRGYRGIFWFLSCGVLAIPELRSLGLEVMVRI